MKKDVFVIGSKGIPAKYGGYETFVEELTKNQRNCDINYHIACKVGKNEAGNKRQVYNGADCFNVYVPPIGPAQAIYYDLESIRKSIIYAKKHSLRNPIFYILACRIGPFMNRIKKEIHSIGGRIYVNPDGHEWLRSKWSKPVRYYWKLSEKLMVKNADLLICDSSNIENYIVSVYKKFHPKTTFIAYGAYTKKSPLRNDSSLLINWFKKYDIRPLEYYLIVGRFVPENNYETMIREFCKSHTSKKLVIITRIDNSKFLRKLQQKTHFNCDSRIKFVGTIYDKKLLKKIRELSYAYLHGHSVGGTNPSLLEALSSTKVNLLYDVNFNKEVAGEGALYWNKKSNNLANLINKVDKLDNSTIEQFNRLSTNRIIQNYTWSEIVSKYENLFMGDFR